MPKPMRISSTCPSTWRRCAAAWRGLASTEPVTYIEEHVVEARFVRAGAGPARPRRGEARALPKVKAIASNTPKWKLMLKALRGGPIPESVQPHLSRMQLEQPTRLQDKVVQRLLIEALLAA